MKAKKKMTPKAKRSSAKQAPPVERLEGVRRTIQLVKRLTVDELDIHEIAKAIDVNYRSAYRTLDVIRDLGIKVKERRDENHDAQGLGRKIYSADREQVAKALLG